MTQETRKTPQQAVGDGTAHGTARPGWLSLAARCEAAKGADREIDCAVARLLGWEEQHLSGFGGFWMSPEKRMRIVPLWSDSLDAIVTLIERELGWFWRVGHGSRFAGWAHLDRVHPDNCCRGDEASAQAPTPALALCAAFCRAMHEKGARS